MKGLGLEGYGGMSELGWKTGEEEAVVADRGVGPVGTAEGVGVVFW